MREPLSIDLVRTVHRALTEGTYDERRYIVNGERPGDFKRHDYVTGRNEVGSPPDEVEDDLAELIDEINTIGQKAPLKAGAYFHARFENIHPFADGNGRVGRTLLNYWLMINDYPPMIIYEEDRRAYYDALQAYDEQEDLDLLTEFFEDQTVKTWTRSMELSDSDAPEAQGPRLFHAVIYPHPAELSAGRFRYTGSCCAVHSAIHHLMVIFQPPYCCSSWSFGL